MRSVTKILTFWALSTCLWAQLTNMETIPTIRQTAVGSTTAAMGANVVSGNCLIATYHARSQVTTPGIADTLTTTWTNLVSLTAPASDTRGTLYVWRGTASSSGADTVTMTVTDSTQGVTTLTEISNTACSTDATTVTDGTQTLSTTAGSPTSFPSITTATYRALVLDVLETVGDEQIASAANGTHAPFLAAANASDYTYMRYSIAGNPGAVTSTVVGGTGRAIAMAVIALKASSSIAVSTAALPNAVQSQSYSFQLGAKGGAGTNTWSRTGGASLPTGLSLSSAGVISGTPSAGNGDAAMTFQVQDGSSNSATKSLTLHVGTSANTTARLQGTSGTLATLAFSSNVTSGSMLLVLEHTYRCTDLPTDSLGTVFATLPQAANGLVTTSTTTFDAIYWGFATSGGADTVTSHCSNGTISPLGSLDISEWSNVQSIFDTTVLGQTSSYSGGSTITASSLTLPVAETLYAIGAIGTPAGTVTQNAPLSLDNLDTNGQFRSSAAYQIGATVGAQTPNFAVASNTSNRWFIEAFGFRPTTSGTAAQPVTDTGGAELF
jgi:hypothetical protein